MAKKKKISQRSLEAIKNKAKFVQKHIGEGKTVVQCAKEMDMHPVTLSYYKSDPDYRKMAIHLLENSKLNGLEGTTDELVKKMESKDEKTSMTALQEIIKIYGLHAAAKKDTTVTVSLSSDDELFAKIDEAQRDRRYVASHEKGQGGEGMASREQGMGKGDFESRRRVLLQDAAVSEQE